MDFRQGLQKMGHHLENLTFSSDLSSKNCTRFIHFASMFCPNLNKLQMDSLTLDYYIFQKISINLQIIRHLELQNCSINDDAINIFSNITTIEYLDLTNNNELSGTYTNLKILKH
ncbi:uncharacterized protein LOC129606375 [Condylostylus longicornis]|uniref:uncharacterized protein LOC129606375 n=1 Tax=Condylostylus longicornis TaxID=2530218 RepID=UPI00244E2611|nr:uncharacterized protein LOC129606375 [Condylostylus longicornis]